MGLREDQKRIFGSAVQHYDGAWLQQPTLLQFLQELLFYKDAQRLMLRVYEVRINVYDQGFTLQARAAGELLDPAKHALGADVKGVTLHRLQVAQTPNGWAATVVLDV